MVVDTYVEMTPHIIPVSAANTWLSVLPAVADLGRAPHHPPTDSAYHVAHGLEVPLRSGPRL